jgi:SAM-dependent methyltransferase
MRSTVIANADMAAAWDGAEGDDWARDWQHYDRSIRRYHLRLLSTADIARAQDVLDVGCGTGELTRDAGRAASDGVVLGVDLSARMLERARELARTDGLTNVVFEQADAQVYPFRSAAYDIVVSRFGAMFFADPVAAFRNIQRAMRPGARLVLLAWQDLDRNEWLQELRAAMSVGRALPAPSAGAPGPFGLADPAGVRATLAAAGFVQVEIEAAEESFWAGADAEAAFAFISNGSLARGLLDGLATNDRSRALDALRMTLETHDAGDGVWFGSAAWLICASRE